MAIVAIGNAPTTSIFKDELELNPDGTVKANPETLQTSLPYVFAGGDAVLGPSSMVQSMGQGRRAAFHMDRMLRGEPLDVPFGDPLEVADKKDILDTDQRIGRASHRSPCRSARPVNGSRILTLTSFR